MVYRLHKGKTLMFLVTLLSAMTGLCLLLSFASAQTEKQEKSVIVK